LAKVLDRIRKLLALSTDKGASSQEVETAARLAQELMQEHKLTASDIGEHSTDASEIIDLPAGKDGFMATWRFALVTSVARSFFCEAVGLRAGRSRKVRIIGRRDDAEVVLEVTAFLTKEIERLTVDYASLPEEHFLLDELVEGSSPMERRRAYRSGLAFGASSTLDVQAKKWRAASEKALAIYRKGKEEISFYMGKKFGPSRRSRPKLPDEHLTAFDEGFERGQEIEISPKQKGLAVGISSNRKKEEASS